MKSINASDRLIVALDFDTIEEAQQMIRTLSGVVSFFKIGLGLQLNVNVNEFIKPLIQGGGKIFLDYKYYDIEATIERAVAQAAKVGVTFLTVHGNKSIIEAAVRGRGDAPLKLLTVTVLTSLDVTDIQEMGFNCSVEDLVMRRAKYALDSGCDGVITSGLEAAKIHNFAGDNLLIVTPGIRPSGYPKDDQKRITTPYDAVHAGADYLVVGRPIIDAVDPRRAASEMLREMQNAFDGRSITRLAS